MKRIVTCAASASAAAAAALVLLSSAGAASAQEFTITPNIALTSDYVFRGFSQSFNDPALQGGVDLTYGGLYGGAWASTVDFGDGTDSEVDLYGGYRGEAGGFAYDLGVVAYLYTDAPSRTNYDYVELKAAASRAFGPVTAGAAVYYSPDFFGVADGSATYVELNAAYSFAPSWTVSGAVGEQFLNVSDDYATWNVGVGYAFNSNISADVRYFDTDVEGSIFADDRFVVTLKSVF